MVKILLDNNRQFRSEARYACETLFDIMGVSITFVLRPEELRDDDIILYYGLHPEKISLPKIAVSEDEYLYQGGDTPKYRMMEGVPCIYSKEIPVGNSVSDEYTGRSFGVSVDLIAASFYLLSRQEERLNKKRDKWCCFSEGFSMSSVWGITDLPVVNLYAELLLKLIQEVSQKRKLVFSQAPRWPGGKRFAVVLTHDVDTGEKYSFLRALKQIIKAVLERKRTGNLLKYLRRSVFKPAGQDPYWSFQDFMDLESKFGAKSTFYFISESTNRRYDPGYVLKGKIAEYIRGIADKGWEVGLHSSYDSYIDCKMLKRQKKKLEAVLGKEIGGVRQHYLRFSVDDTFKAQVQAGFDYDTTLGYNEDIGFRAGLAAPFFPFDKESGGKFSILELPLNVMDGSLFEFKKYAPDEAFSRVRGIIDRVEGVGGLLVVLWHMKARDEEEFLGWWDVYRRILEYLKQKEAWITSASEIDEWWRSRIKHLSGPPL